MNDTQAKGSDASAGNEKALESLEMTGDADLAGEAGREQQVACERDVGEAGGEQQVACERYSGEAGDEQQVACERYSGASGTGRAPPETCSSGSAVLEQSGAHELPPMPLEERFFGFHPSVLVQEIEQSVRDLLEDALDGLEISLYRDCSLDPELCKENAVDGEGDEARRVLLQQGLMKLREELLAALYAQIDRLEVYLLRNIFHIPFGLRIPGVNAPESLDENWERELGVDPNIHNLDATSDDEDAVDRELVALRQSLRNARQAQQRIQKERVALAACFRRLERDAQSRVAAVLSSGEMGYTTNGALAEQVAAVAGAVQQLEHVVNSCKDQLAQVSLAGDSDGALTASKAGANEPDRRGPLPQRIRRPLELERIFEMHTKEVQVESLDAVKALHRALHRSC